MGACRSVQVDDARTACERLVRTLRFFPTVAEFFNEEAAARRAREHREAAERGLPEPTGVRPGRERVTGMLGQLREEIAYEGARGHWHGGPGPCPKCGGISPKPGVVPRDKGHSARVCSTCQAGQHWEAVRSLYASKAAAEPLLEEHPVWLELSNEELLAEWELQSGRHQLEGSVR